MKVTVTEIIRRQIYNRRLSVKEARPLIATATATIKTILTIIITTATTIIIQIATIMIN